MIKKFSLYCITILCLISVTRSQSFEGTLLSKIVGNWYGIVMNESEPDTDSLVFRISDYAAQIIEFKWFPLLGSRFLGEGFIWLDTCGLYCFEVSNGPRKIRTFNIQELDNTIYFYENNYPSTAIIEIINSNKFVLKELERRNGETFILVEQLFTRR